MILTITPSCRHQLSVFHRESEAAVGTKRLLETGLAGRVKENFWIKTLLLKNSEDPEVKTNFSTVMLKGYKCVAKATSVHAEDKRSEVKSPYLSGSRQGSADTGNGAVCVPQEALRGVVERTEDTRECSPTCAGLRRSPGAPSVLPGAVGMPRGSQPWPSKMWTRMLMASSRQKKRHHPRIFNPFEVSLASQLWD